MKFNFKKITQIINILSFLEQETENKPIDKLKTLKLVFFIDRYFLRKYWQLVTWDTYFAMNLWPVPSWVKDVFEVNWDVFSKDQIRYISTYLLIIWYTIKSIKQPDLSFLSKLELDTINLIYKNFWKKNSNNLVKLTHIYPEWKKYEEIVKNYWRHEMNIEDFFENPLKKDWLFELPDDELKESLKIYRENVNISKCFG